MRYNLILFLLSLTACNLENMNIADSRKWEVNKPIFYDVEYTEITTNKDSIILVKKSNYKVELTVNEIGDSNSITWSIKYATRTPDSLMTDTEKLISDTITYKEEYRIIYQTNKFGQYQKIVNWDELEKYITKNWEDFIRTLDINTTSKKESITKIESIFMNRSALESKLIIAISPLHCIYGHPFSNQITKTKEIMTGLHNKPINTTMTREILAEENDYILMQITNKYDSKQLQKQIYELSKDINNIEYSGQISMNDTCNVGYNKQTCWPYEVQFWRITKDTHIQKNINISLKQL